MDKIKTDVNVKKKFTERIEKAMERIRENIKSEDVN